MMKQDYMKSRIVKLVSDKNSASEVDSKDTAVMNLFQDSLAYKNLDNVVDLEKIKSDIYSGLSNVAIENHTDYLANKSNYIWGVKPSALKTEIILKNTSLNKKIYILEDTFLRSVIPTSQIMTVSNKLYVYSCGYIIDDLSHYVDATRPSRIEQVINSDWQISDDQKQRAKNLIKKITDNKVTKYNNQPIFEPKIGRDGVKKVLVIDQSYNDYSIIKGNADDQTFKNMLDTAIKDNPGADIIIKTHPDAIGTLSLRQKCYYQNIESKGNVYRLTDAINPISLIEYSDKVYVCSSQFGFEALMCGKDVYTFGMPFYAGWGLTKDAQKCQRRVRQRTVEEIFYIAYIMFSLYINPETGKPCEIEDAIDFLIELREKYFKEQNNG